MVAFHFAVGSFGRVVLQLAVVTGKAQFKRKRSRGGEVLRFLLTVNGKTGKKLFCTIPPYLFDGRADGLFFEVALLHALETSIGGAEAQV